MRINKGIKLGIFFLIGILLLSSFVMAYYRSQPNYFQYGPYDRTGSMGTGFFEDRMCKAGQDFILQISPLGCEPAMVRSDLLEEINTPVLCPISATQMNPLIDVQAINTITITGKYPKEVATVGFYPAEAALNPYQNKLSQPIVLDNIGYAVIVLRKQPNESAMPDYVEGNLTARIRYDIQNAFGVGQSQFYLPVLDENDWAEKYKQYSFWDGRGYLRAEGVYDNQATISIYSDQSRSGILGQGDGKLVYSTVTLKEGETSPKLYIPGFDFCLATMRIKLNSLENPGERARFKINGNPFEVKDREKFLENDCRIISMEKNGINSDVSFTCREDREGFHRGVINLQLFPKIILNIDGKEKNSSVGDYLYTNEENDKKVFLAYVGTTGNTGNEKDLYTFLMAIPSGDHPSDTLTLSEIRSAKRIAEGYRRESKEQRNIGAWFVDTGQFIAGIGSNFLKWVKDGENFKSVDYEEEPKPMFGKQIELFGFADATDSELPPEVEDAFEKAEEDYREIIDSYSNEDNPNAAETLGESALYELIKLADSLKQKITMTEFCDEFEQRYPDSKKSLTMCKDKMKMSSSTSSVTEVLINDHVYQISFEGIYEPTEYEYSAKIRVDFPGGTSQRYTLINDDPLYLDSSEGEYISLESLEEDSAKLNLNIKRSGTLGNILESRSEIISLNSPETYSGYTLTLTEVNLKKVAKVSLIANDDYAQTNATFSFRVNIDKRDIKLSPEKTQERIEKLNEQIKKWDGLSKGLWKFVKRMKEACLGTGGYLTVKNYLQNTGGKGIARDSIMNSEGGWYERCDDLVAEGIFGPNGEKYSTQEECLIENSDYIDKDVDSLYEIMDAQNKKRKQIQDKYKEEGELFSKDIIDTNKFIEEYTEETVRPNIDTLGDTFEDPEGRGETINIEDMKTVLSVQGFRENKYSIEQLRDIDLYTKVLSSDVSDEVKEMAEQSLYSTFLDVQVNSRNYASRSNLADDLGISASSIAFLETSWNSKKIPYGETIYGDIQNDVSIPQLSSTTPVQILQTDLGEKYLIVLDDSAGTDMLPIKRVGNVYQIYGMNGSLIPEEKIPPQLEKVYFQRYDDASYKNEYRSPKVRYYETEPYKGYPAIVPFDLKEGWYVAVEQNLPVFGGTASYSSSGRVESYYLCNVGRNNREENLKGDDICRSVNSISGEAYDQFPGISDKGKARNLIIKASDAVYQAQRQYRTGVRQVTINGKSIEVGNPAVDVPGMKCQDFMSPKDCNLLFNVCDPVVCPSSRCDFGGNYPVQDVIQSGIIGSIALCLPNAKEGIYVPVCLTGVQAGLDGWVSILKSYRGCLQENLDTGQTIGICDEIRSVYICEYFYRQALPLAKFGIPKLTELIVGKGSRGGGEYLGVADAFQRAEASLGYFTQYYAQNSYEAFKARSMEEAGQEIVCDKFLSLNYPGGNLLDAITTPDSPVRFYGRFDEIPYTTATNPPQSQYKVFYHIYAGNDRGAYYRVYLKGDMSSSFYQDTMFRMDVATGYIGKGDSYSDAKDFLAPSGYKELCIMVNGQEECGFKEVTTNFVINYVRDSYVASQANQTDIKTESACQSGTSSLYSLLNPNIQAGVEEASNPAIYNHGVTRICATRNPGEGTDGLAGMEGSRWVEVGYCGDVNLKCWLNTESVKNAIDFKNMEEDVLKTTTENYQSILQGEGDYLSGDAFNSEIEKIENTEDNEEKIYLISKIINKVFYNNQKASLLYLRGNAYGRIAIALYNELIGPWENKCDSFGKEKCDGTKIMRCSTEGEWVFFTDCATTSRRCIVENNVAKCITSEEADDIISGREEEEIDVYEVLLDYESLKFVLDRGVFNQEICYKYFDNQWHWSSDCNKIGAKKYVSPNFRTSVPEPIYTYDWIPVTTLENPYGREPSNNELEFIKTLQNKVFKDGFNLLIDRTLSDNGATLSTSQIKFYERGLFELFLPRAGDNLYFRFEDNRWSWSFAGSIPILGERRNSWVVSPNTNDLVTDLSPHIAYHRIILLLEGKNFYEGAKFLFLESIESDEEDREWLSLDELEIGEDLRKVLDEGEFSKEEIAVISNAQTCKDCGEELEGYSDNNRCDTEECSAISVKLSKELGLTESCDYNGWGGCITREAERNKWGWETWEDVKKDFLREFDSEERTVILNADDCKDCGEEISGTKEGINRCDEAECVAIGFKLRDEDGLNKMCFHQGLSSCRVILVSEKTGNILGDITGGEKCPRPPEVTPDIEVIGSANLKVLAQIEKLAGTLVPEDLDADSNGVTNCFDPPKYIYDSAGVWPSCVYSDKEGTTYDVFGTTIKTGPAPTKAQMDAGVPWPSFAVNEICPTLGKEDSEKLGEILDKGYLLSYAYDNTQSHNVIFVGWDPSPPNARVFGWKRSGSGHVFGYSTVDLSDDAHPVLMMWEPKLA